MMLKKYSQLKSFEGLRGPSSSPRPWSGLIDWGEGRVRGTPQSAIRIPQSKGFTLIEVILIMVIIGILSATVIPRYDFATSTRASVDGAAYIVASDIRYAQEWAMANRISKRIDFNSGSSSHSFNPTSSLDPSGQLPEGVTINAPGYTVRFNSLGEPILGGGGSVTVSSGGVSKTITVEQYTGKANIP